ncbi:DUF3800 domain-containing protein [Macellibacteroides fermentans]|uniref:DUF3800 domain-containing protein n=1 Tax=Macellibacteroides fermentans TaxID=879969 RepID=UPI00406CB4CB
MLYDVYCDESRQDLIVRRSSISDQNRYVCIGGMMLPSESRENFKSSIKELKSKHNLFGELRWGNVSNNKVEFYLELVDLFFNTECSIDFRTVVIDAYDIDNEIFNDSDHELGYYKFYYQLLYHWMEKNKRYYIFTDFKTNKDRSRLQTLKEILNRVCRENTVELIQSIDSKESLLLQFQNVLMGAVGYKFNYGNQGQSDAKMAVVMRIEKHLGHPIMPTKKSDKKFNIFMIELRKGSI